MRAIYAYYHWFKTAPMQPVALPISFTKKAKIGLLGSMVVGAFLGAALYGQISSAAISEAHWLQLFVRKWVVTSVGILVAELVIFSVIWQFRARR